MENLLAPIAHADLIATSYESVDAIKTAAGLTDPQFAALCMPVLRRYADHVQRLPLMSSAFGSPRGAWDFGLAAAMVAYRYAGTVIFYPTLGAEERRLLEPQCRYMAFLATLSTAVATVAESSSIRSGDDEYHPLVVDDTLYGWLTRHPDVQFSWRVPATPLSAQASAAIAANFVPKRLLANFDLRAVLMLFEAITPKTTMNGVESTLARVVRQAVQGVLDHYRSKQAGTFQVEANQQNLSASDANKVASKMVAQANPTILENPLDKASPAKLDSTQVDLAADKPTLAASPAQPETSSVAQAPEAPQTQPAAAAAPAAILNVAVPPPTTSSAAMTPDGDPLAKAPKVLREWFSALAKHPQFHVLKDQLVMNAEGIEVPVSMLGMFGISGASIRKMMEEAGLILRRSDNARGVILHPGLRDRFISQ